MNKKAVNILMENLVFILLVLVFTTALFFGITRAGSSSILYEQMYAKQIVLIIDKAKPGTELELDTFEMQRLARKNNFDGNILSINNIENEVNVRLVNGKGYSYKYFSNVDVAWNLDKEKRKLFLKIIENQKNKD